MKLHTTFSRWFSVVVFLVVSLTSGSVLAQQAESTEADAIMSILRAGSSEPVTFTEEFTNAVSVEEVNNVIAQVVGQMGEPVSIAPHGDGYEVRSDTHKIQVRITLTGDGQVSGLFFAPIVPIAVGIDEAAAALTGLEGDSGLLVWRNGEELVAVNADTALAVGSAFKLGILSVLAEQIESGERSWDDVVTLEAQHKSVPSTGMEKFPAGSPFTLHTVAGLMISQSDNTATDLLLDLVGRNAVSDRLGQVTLSTRELFQLKGQPDLRADYLSADDAGKLEVLERLADAPPPSPSIASAQFIDGLEWYLSARQLCELIEPLHALDVFDINPGIASPADWADIAYKGGSETGVMNLTTHLTDDAGDTYCVVYTLNRDAAIDEQAVFGAYAGLLSSLKETVGG